MSTLNLEQNLERLGEELEENPDPWFVSPKGFLLKPPFGHERSNLLKSMLGSGLKKRWFILNYTENTLKYFESDDPKAQLKGTIDLSIVKAVKIAQDSSLPEFSLELVSEDTSKNYVISAESFSIMVRWAFAIIRAISKGDATIAEIGLEDLSLKDSGLTVVSSRWLEYDIEYEGNGSLMMNVTGYVNRDKDGNFLCNLVAVTSFQYHSDGTPGVSELSGAIRLKDYLIKVNDTDLLNISFEDALEVIANTPSPKTLHFCRDNMITGDALRQVGWAYVFYPSLNRRRKRCLELDYDVLNFKKMEPGGSASSRRDAYFNIQQVQNIRPLIDKTVPSDQQYTLILTCSPNSAVNHVDQDDRSQGGSYVNTLELCFSTLQLMNQWRYALSLPLTLSDGTQTAITLLPEETVEQVDTNTVQTMNRLAIKDQITGIFIPRVFSIAKGALSWKRLQDAVQPGLQSSALIRTRSLFIANASQCDLRSLRLIKDPRKEVSGYEYQLVIETTQRTVIMGMSDASTLSQWTSTLSDLVSVAPPELRQHFKPPDIIEVVHLGNEGALPVLTDEDPNRITRSIRVKSVAALLVRQNGKVHHEGYLYLKSDTSVFSVGDGSSGFRRYWFSLYSTDMVYSKSKADGIKNPVGSIDLKEVYAVKEMNDDSAPENGFELVTANRSFILVAESEADQLSWIDTVSDRLEEKKAAAREDAFELAAHLPRPQKIDAMKRSTQFSGILVKKMNNGTWKERFFVLANRCLTYYDYQETFYTDYKDSLGVINLSDIVQVNSSQLAKCKNTGFDVHAHSHRGERDDRGVRVYTFNAHIDSLCVQWMTAIVENIGGLKLKQISRPGDDSVFYVSVRLDHNSARIMSARGSALIDLSSPRSVAVSNPNPNPVSDKVDSNTISSSTTSTTAPSTVTGSVPAHLRLSQMFPAGSSPGKPSPVLRTTTTTMTAVVTMTRNSSSCPFLTTVKENQTRSVSGANSPSSRPNSAASRSHSTQSLLLQSSNHGTVLADEANILQKLTDDQS